MHITRSVQGLSVEQEPNYTQQKKESLLYSNNNSVLCDLLTRPKYHLYDLRVIRLQNARSINTLF